MPHLWGALLLCALLTSPAFALAARQPDAETIDRSKALSTAPLIDAFEATARDGRTVSIRRYAPATQTQNCLVVFSHGYASKGASYDRILIPLAEAGYRVYAPLHVDSTDHPDNGAYPASQNTPFRIADVKTALASARSRLARDRDFCWLAVGHSFGALISQIFGGAAFPDADPSGVPEPRRVIALSPPGPIPGLIPADAFDAIQTPMLVVTGSDDLIMTTEAGGWRDHLYSHENAPEGVSTAAAFNGMDHYFNGLYGRPVERPLTPADEALIELIISFANGAEPPPSLADYLLPAP